MRNRRCQGKIRKIEDYCQCWERMTHSRETVLKILQDSTGHLTADEIFIKARKINPYIGLTSVYRTLEKLIHTGKVLKIDIGDKTGRFELIDDNKKHHHHLICKNCGEIIDYTDFLNKEVKFLKEIEQELSRKYNFLIKSHIIQFYGLCERCR